MKLRVFILLALIGWSPRLVAAVAADAALAIETLDGKTVTPLRAESRAPAVLFFITHDCPISNAYAREYQRLRREYVRLPMYLVYVDPDAKRKDLIAHWKQFGLTDIPAIHDLKHRLVRATGAQMTPEAVVIGAAGKIEYRGRVDNLYADYGKRRRIVTSRDLREALNALLAGRPVKRPRTEAIGCFIPPLPEK